MLCRGSSRRQRNSSQSGTNRPLLCIGSAAVQSGCVFGLRFKRRQSLPAQKYERARKQKKPIASEVQRNPWDPKGRDDGADIRSCIDISPSRRSFLFRENTPRTLDDGWKNPASRIPRPPGDAKARKNSRQREPSKRGSKIIDIDSRTRVPRLINEPPHEDHSKR